MRSSVVVLIVWIKGGLFFARFSPAEPFASLRFRGRAFSRNVHVCLLETHNRQRRGSWRTRLLFRFLHSSHGRSLRDRVDGAVWWSCLSAGRLGLALHGKMWWAPGTTGRDTRGGIVTTATMMTARRTVI